MGSIKCYRYVTNFICFQVGEHVIIIILIFLMYELLINMASITFRVSSRRCVWVPPHSGTIMYGKSNYTPRRYGKCELSVLVHQTKKSGFVFRFQQQSACRLIYCTIIRTRPLTFAASEGVFASLGAVTNLWSSGSVSKHRTRRFINSVSNETENGASSDTRKTFLYGY